MQSFFRLQLLAIFVCLCALPAVAEDKPLSESTDLAAVKKTLKLREGETAIFVGDMHCANCAKKVARKLYGVKGVVKVRSDIKIDVAIVTPQKSREVDPQALWDAVEASGILPLKLIGPAGVIEADAEARKAALKTQQDHAADATTTR